jgi:hypothetical protein
MKLSIGTILVLLGLAVIVVLFRQPRKRVITVPSIIPGHLRTFGTIPVR